MLSKELIAQREIELNKSIPFTYPEKLRKPHFLVVKLKEYLKGEKPDSWQNPGMIWSRRNLSVNTTRAVSKRAILFMDTLIKLLESRGHKIMISNFTTKVVIQDIDLDIALREVYKVLKPAVDWRDQRKMGPTGKLCLKLDEIGGREWYDGAKPLENQIFHILATLEIYAEYEIERNKRWAEEKRLEEIEKAKRKERQRIMDEEQARFKDIFTRIDRWKKSQMIREFLSIAGNTLNKEDYDWISKKADWMDPLVEREDEILGKYADVT